MLTLRLRFPAGRYHATPYGHHVNEGIVEWPPSPWRLVRALVARGYATLGWLEVPEAARRLVSVLSSTLPRYRLPQATLAHSRHYMPLGSLKKGREETTLVFDAWADVGDGEVLIGWDIDLDSEAHSLLAELASTLDYLGRSESWVEGQLLASSVAWPDGEDDAYPHDQGRRPGSGWEQVATTAPVPASEYVAWREESVAAGLASIRAPADGRRPGAKKLVADRMKVETPYPSDLVTALQRDTAWWKQHRWSQPPGSRRVLYWRRRDALAVTVPVRAYRRQADSVEAMLLAITTPSGRTSALPSVNRTLPQAQLLHRALVSRVGRGQRIDCPEIVGRDPQRKPLEGHRHAHILPLDLAGTGRLDHVIVYAKMGLGPSAQQAIRSLRRTWTKGGVGGLQVAVAGCGSLDDLRRLPSPCADAITRLLGPLTGASVWTSETVFVPPRHIKRRGRNTLEGQVQDELASRGMPPARVEILPWDDSTLRLRHSIRVRAAPAKSPPADIGFVLRLRFERSILGPLLLGYGAHFGLGRFGCSTS